MRIASVLMRRDGLTLEEANAEVAECRKMIAEGEDPEEVLSDLGLEIDYIFELLL